MIEWLRRLFGGKAQAKTVTGAIEAFRPMPKTIQRSPQEEAILTGTASAGMRARTLNLSSPDRAFTLPRNLCCFHLNLAQSPIESLPEDLHAEFGIDLTGGAILELPAGLKTGSLTLSGCRKLRALPDGLEVNFLNVEGCVALEKWPESAHVTLGSINARGCTALRALPAGLGPLTNLDVSGCSRIDALPPGLKLGGWLDLAGTKIQGLPESLCDVRLRWHGVAINARIAFFPETLTPAEILAEPNAEVRRVMIERHGLDRFISGAEAAVIDEDTDPGGPRRLLVVQMPGDEPLVCIAFSCPSTGRQYIVRVPPATRTCREAVAWTAGFDRAEEYHPIVET